MENEWPFEFPGTYWIDEQEEQAVLDVLRNGSLFRYYGLGDPSYVDKLEERARKLYGVRYALAVNSGTGALITCLTSLGIGPGSEVIIPAFMWVATVGAVVQVGAIPVLCEIDDSFSMSPADLERKITPRTKLIIPIHMAGAPCDIGSIIKVADKHGIPVLEDCAQCNGGEFRGRKVGTFGKMGMFSLQLNKNMTCGEGGLIVTDDEKLYARAFSSHDMGLVRVEGRLDTPESYAILWGGGRRLPELSGAVASVQITKLPRILENMRGSKQRIKGMMEDIRGLEFRRLNDADGDTGPFLILVLADERKAARVAEKLIDTGLHNVFQISEYGLHIYSNILSLVNKVGVTGTGDPWALVENQKSVYDYNKGACPVSDALFGRSVLVPIPSKLTSAQEKYAAEAIRSAVT